MRRLVLIVAVFAAAGWLALGAVAATAQVATPAADEDQDELDLGVSPEFIAMGVLGELPPNPELILLIRLTLEPGAAFPPGPDDQNDPDDATGGFVVVESGAVTVRSPAPLTVSRAAQPGELPPMEEVAADAEATLGPGDAVYLGPFGSAVVRNDGDEPAVFLLVLIGPGEGSGEAEPEEATPTA